MSDFDFLGRGRNSGLKYKYLTAVSDTDPDAGNLKFDQTDLRMVNKLLVSDTDRDLNDNGPYIGGWDASTTPDPRAHLFLRRETAPEEVAIFKVVGFNEDTNLLSAMDPNTNGAIRAVAIQADGKTIIGGDFTSVSPNGGALVTRNRVARFNADGTLDAGFDPDVDDTVHSIVVQDDGQILIGGAFQDVGGLTRKYGARLDSITGVPDSWDPSCNAAIRAILIEDDGRIIIGGDFIKVNGITHNRIARVDATTGALDVTWDPDPSSIGSANVYALALQDDDKILAGGLFTTIGGAARNFIARLNPVTGLADSFDAQNCDEQVTAIAVQSDGQILVGGAFANIGGHLRDRMARLNNEGLADSNFDPGPNHPVNAIVLQQDGKILVGGEFTTIGGATRMRLARLDPSTGTAEAAFDPNIDPLVAPPSATVYAIAVRANDDISFGGVFAEAEATGRNNFARLTLTYHKLQVEYVSGATSFDDNTVIFIEWTRTGDRGLGLGALEGKANLVGGNTFTGGAQIIDTGSNGATNVEGLNLRNDTASTNFVQTQNAPLLVFSATAWDPNFDFGAGRSDTWEMNEAFRGLPGTGPGTTARFSWEFSQNGDPYVEKSFIDSLGNMGATGYITAGEKFSITGTGSQWYAGQFSLDSDTAFIFNNSTLGPLNFLSINTDFSAWKFYANGLTTGNLIEGMVISGFGASYLKLGETSDFGATFSSVMFDLDKNGNLDIAGNFAAGGTIVGSNFSGTHSGTFSGTFSGTHSGDSSGTNTGDQSLAGLLATSGGTMTGQLIARAGATGANTAGILLQSGPLQTTAQAGAFEFLTDAFYLTQTTGVARKSIVLAPAAGPITFAGTTSARIITVPVDAAFTMARKDAAQTFAGTQTFAAIVASGITLNGTSQPMMLLAPTSSFVQFIGKIPTTGDFAQFGFQNPAGSQRGFFGYIGATFGTAARQDHFEIGSTTATGIYFRPGDTGNSFIMDASGNFLMAGAAGGITAVGTSGANVLGISNAGTAPTTSPADMIQIFAVDESAGNCTLGLRTEIAVVTEVVLCDTTLKIKINGTIYKLLLHT